MVSAIDPTKPAAGEPKTQDIRDNFQAAHDEITALQLGISGSLASPSPIGSVTPNTGRFTTLAATILTVLGVREAAVSMSAGVAINCALGDFFVKTISVNTTFTVTGVSPSGTSTSFVLELTNGGSRVITWWGGMKWPGGIPPILTVAGVDVLGFYTLDGGVTWRGSMLQRDSR